MIARIEDFLMKRSHLGGLILRVQLGVVFMAHGYLAAFVYTPAGTAQFFANVGIPFPAFNAWVLILVHLTSGAMIIAGLFTRLNALLHFAMMAVAVVMVHASQGFYLSAIILDAANGVAMVGGYEYALTVTIATLALVFIGPGALALDHVISASSRTGKAGAPQHG